MFDSSAATGPTMHPGPQTGRRRRFTLDEKRRLLDEASRPGETVSSVGRRHGLSVSLLFRWRRQITGEAAPRAKAASPVATAGARQLDEVRRLREQIRELQRLLGKKTLEIELLRDQLRHGDAPALRASDAPSVTEPLREAVAATRDGRA